MLPLAGAMGGIAIAFGIAKTLKEGWESNLTEEELEKIRPILEEIELTPEEIQELDSEEEVSSNISEKLSKMSQEDQERLKKALRDCLHQDHLFN